MYQCHSIIIDWGISALGNGKEFGDGLNDFDKRYIYQLIYTVKLPGSNIFDSQIQMNTGNQKYYSSLAKEFKHHMTKEHRKNCVFGQRKYKNDSYKENG